MLRQPLVVVMGNVDSGKCIHPDSLISLENGEIIKIGDFWEILSKEKDVIIEKDKLGFYIKPNRCLFSVNLNSKKFERKKIYRICKLKSPNELIKITNTLGYKIKTTKEHKFFILDKLTIKEKNAKDLIEGDYILCPKVIPRDSWNYLQIRDFAVKNLLEENNLLFKLNTDKNAEIGIILRNKQILSKYREQVKFNRYRNQDIEELKQFIEIKTKNIVEIKSSSNKWRVGHTSNWMTIPVTKEDYKDLFYLIGVLFGDGTANSTITNVDPEIQKEVIRIFQKLNLNSKIYLTKNISESILNSGGKTLKLFLQIIFDFPIEKKANNLKLPKIIQIADEEYIGKFLSGLYDTDGYVCNKGTLEVCTASKQFADSLTTLFNYIGCSPNNYIKKVNGKDYYNLILSGKEELGKIQAIMDLKLLRKKSRLFEIEKKAVSSRKLDIFPIEKENIRELRIKLGLSQNELQIPYWKNYELKQNLTKQIMNDFVEFCQRNKGEIYKKIQFKKEMLENTGNQIEIIRRLNSVWKGYNFLRELSADNLIEWNKKEKKYSITEYGKAIKKFWNSTNIEKLIDELYSLKPLLNTEVHFVKIKNIEVVQSDCNYVYDLSEPFNQNFTSNGFLIHNTKTLDTIRRTAVVESEPGAITQMISSSSISLKTIQKICGDLLKNKKIDIPGLVFIDTPGHAAFSNMRKRGGNLADLAVLVIDINEGIKPQTEECIAILKTYKTPFVIALNKLDLLNGWKAVDSKFILDMISKQSSQVQTVIETKLYEIVGKLYSLGIQADRFDRVDDYTKTIAIVPCSAKNGEGVPELLMVLIGLALKYLEENLQLDSNAAGKGTVLEVKEEQGLGTCLDVIIYEGKIRVNDPIIIGGLNEPVVTKVKGLFLPDEKNKYGPVKEVVAAAGVKVNAVGIKEVVAGMPIFVINNDEKELRKKIQEEVEEVVMETDSEGIVVKADSLGSLEAVIGMLKDRNIPFKKASVGIITKKDIIDAQASEDLLNKIILCFNIDAGDVKEVKVISHNVIYQLIEDLEKWRDEETKKEEEKELQYLIRPAKVKFLRGCTFRQNNPCVIGVEIISGTLRPDVDLIKNNGDVVGHIKTIEYEKESVKEAERGIQVALSIPGVTAGRQIHEEDIFYVDMNENNFKKLKEFKKFLTTDEINILKEVAEIKRKVNNLWGV